MKAIALTGATSMIGIALVKQCIEQGIHVFALVRKTSKHLNRLPKSSLITLWECDLDKIKSFTAAPQNFSIDTFYHIGWTFTDKAGRASCEKQLTNIQYTLDAVHLAKRLGCKRFIGAGSQAEYGIPQQRLNGTTPANPITPYGIAKYAAGKLSQIECNLSGLEHIWVRILSVYGTNDSSDTLIQTFIEKCRNNQPMPLTPCTHIWDYLFEEDAGKAFLLIGEKGICGKIYCLGSGQGMPLQKFITIITKLVNPGYQPEYGRIPYSANMLKYLCADITELMQDTGWKPKTDFEKGIKKLLEHKTNVLFL